MLAQGAMLAHGAMLAQGAYAHGRYALINEIISQLELRGQVQGHAPRGTAAAAAFFPLHKLKSSAARLSEGDYTFLS
jgi:hypothetical protein